MNIFNDLRLVGVTFGFIILIGLLILFIIRKVVLKNSSKNEIEEQTQALRIAQERLQLKQEELEIMNDKLIERTKILEQQKNDIDIKNQRLQKNQKELEEKANALKLANNYKSQFLANMSHELRTPLNSILVLSQLLANKEDNKALSIKEKEFASTIYSSGTDLLKLINSILDFSKLEAGKMIASIESEDIRCLVSKVEKTFRQLADEKNINLIVDINEDVPEIIYTDAQKLQQILNNLISNALKFTEKGSVSLKLSKYKDEMIDISVTDTGIGIPLDKHKMIFEAFSQSDGTTSRKYGGTGLGLSISSELVKLLGGNIYLNSEVGMGSTFNVVLPIYNMNINMELNQRRVQLNNQVLLEHKSDMKVEYDLKARKILIIDNDMRSVFTITNVLEGKGVKVVVGKNGVDGIQKLNCNIDIDLVLIDIIIPEINGCKAINEIRADKRFKEIPIIVLTAKRIKVDGQRCIEMGVNDYLEKPIDNDKLLDGIINCLSKSDL